MWSGALGHVKNIFPILALREKCPNTELFLVRIFPHSDWIRRDTKYLQYVKTKLKYDTNFRIWIGKNKSSKLIQLFQAISHTIWSLCELDRTYWNEERAGTSWNHLELPVETTWNKLEPRGTIWNQQRTSKKTNFIGDYCARKILLPNEIQHYQQLCHKELHLVDVVKVFHTRPCFIYPFNRRAIITFNESTAHVELLKQCVNHSKIPCWKLMK